MGRRLGAGSDQVSMFLPETGMETSSARPPIVDGWASWSGTSFATPNFVAALSVLLANSPSQTAYEAWRTGPGPGAPSLASRGIVTGALSHPSSCSPP
jgi:subtilisin family serine protease